jgi:hypothetical protein
MKTVLLVAPHFVPSFLPSVHRARLWSHYLPEFGWRPIILTTDEKYYECQVDDEMTDLIPEGLEVIRAGALPTKPIRLVGDLGIRSLPYYYRAIARLAEQGKIDFVHFTVPAYNASLIGRLIHRKYGIPYGIDYIDPWVYESPADDRVFSKAWLSQVWAKLAEPWAVRHARLVTGINQAYFQSVLRRNPHLRDQAVTAAMPYGWSEKDAEAVKLRPRPATLFDPHDGNLHLIYAGALLPRAIGVLERFLAAIALLPQLAPETARRLRVHFVGTGRFENDPTRGHLIMPLVEKYGLTGSVNEFPARIPYLGILNHLAQASGILVIGSIESHYSPSKIFQAIMSGRPVFALLHKDSTAIPILRASNAGTAFTFTPDELPEVKQLAGALAAFCASLTSQPTEVNWALFADSSARDSSRILASALDAAVQKG